jgi:hypothetical protein
METIRCQMCSQKTDGSIKVNFYGWNREVNFPIRIVLCPRCHGNWKEDNID